MTHVKVLWIRIAFADVRQHESHRDTSCRSNAPQMLFSVAFALQYCAEQPAEELATRMRANGDASCDNMDHIDALYADLQLHERTICCGRPVFS